MDELMREVEADPSTLGLVLHGSRASGVGRPDSDFDLVRVVTDEEYERRAVHEKRGNTDVILQTPTRLRRRSRAAEVRAAGARARRRARP
ncbi:MAG TPA: nucleotidyltransferase domain-containing protein [Gaiellaceae bacterium]|nr:nucleotidyltransferase domain-containing protein [Gaiellaceae bacterium]